MTDNIIPRDEAIDRMKAGLPCETYINNGVHNGVWLPTKFAHFDSGFSEFRKPPEPRRVAREWQIHPKDGYIDQNGQGYPGCIRVREILPGDVVLQRSAIEEIAKWADSGRHDEDLRAIASELRGLLGEES